MLFAKSDTKPSFVCLCVFQGTTVESICWELKYLPVTRILAKEHVLLILCDLSYLRSDAVEVAMVNITFSMLISGFLVN